MNLKIKASAVTTTLLSAMFMFESEVYSQDPTTSPTPSAREAVSNKRKSGGENESQGGAAAPAPTPEPDFWTRETMTGDWGGTRSRWKEKGVELEFKQSNFVQGVASGGIRESSLYNGKFEMTWKFDLAKVVGWKWWSSEIKSEVRSRIRIPVQSPHFSTLVSVAMDYSRVARGTSLASIRLH